MEDLTEQEKKKILEETIEEQPLEDREHYKECSHCQEELLDQFIEDIPKKPVCSKCGRQRVYFRVDGSCRCVACGYDSRVTP
jgi:hypothetical protein